MENPFSLGPGAALPPDGLAATSRAWIAEQRHWLAVEDERYAEKIRRIRLGVAAAVAVLALVTAGAVGAAEAAFVAVILGIPVVWLTLILTAMARKSSRAARERVMQRRIWLEEAYPGWWSVGLWQAEYQTAAMALRGPK